MDETINVNTRFTPNTKEKHINGFKSWNILSLHYKSSHYVTLYEKTNPMPNNFFKINYHYQCIE